MIGLGKACNGGGALMNYVYDLKRGYELDRNLLCGDSPKQLVEEFKIIQSLNQRGLNKMLSFVISPDPKDVPKLNKNDLIEMSKEFLNLLEIDTDSQQYVTFVHTDKDHLHLHILANRVIQANGKLISDHHIGKRAQWAAHKIAMKRNLISAKNKMIENIKTKDDLKVLKKKINSIHETIMKQKPPNFEVYKRNMMQNGVDVFTVLNSNGIVQGFNLIEFNSQIQFKASEINRQNGILELYNNPNKVTNKIKI